MGLFNDLTFEIPCPNCNHEFSISKKQIGSSVVCPNCKSNIHLKDDGLLDELNNADKAINDALKGL